MNKLEEKLEEYKERFNDNFPTIPLMRGRSDKEVIAMIDACLKANKNVAEMGFYSSNEDLLY